MQFWEQLLTSHPFQRFCACLGGVAEDLSATLSSGCPSFFKEDDKTFYQASGLLQRAEGTPAAAERAHLVREALRLMLKVKTNFQNRDLARPYIRAEKCV